MKDTAKTLDEITGAMKKLADEIASVVVGQKDIVNALFTAVLADGHILLEGVPGLGKTLLVCAFARATGLTFSRIQFTPDLLPQDITGSEILDEDHGKRSFRFIKGPVFANIVLADEINRTPPKTQSALLEAMQERQVTNAGKTYPLPKPFLVLATQNPLEHEGTYPLPEAQLDRFLFHVTAGYPTEDEEITIARRNTESALEKVKPVLSEKDILRYRAAAAEIPAGDAVTSYAVNLLRSTRPESSSSDKIKKYVACGVGPRASRFLMSAAKAYAALSGAHAVTKEIEAVLPAVVRHRVIINFQGQAEGFTAADVLRWIR